MTTPIFNVLAHAAPGAGRRGRQTRVLRPVRPAYADELAYRAELQALVDQLRAATEQVLLPALAGLPTPRATDGALGAVDRGSGYFAAVARDTVTAAVERMRARFVGVGRVAQGMASRAANRTLASVDARLAASVRRALGIDVASLLRDRTPVAARLAEKVAENVALIASIPAQHLEKLLASLLAGVAAGEGVEALTARARATDDATARRAQRIALDQTSKLNVAFNAIRQPSLGIERYRWRTREDEKVRPTHAAHDGEIIRWDSPPADTGHAGEENNCRCEPEPVFDLDPS